MTTKLEPQIDELYSLPLDAFTSARNALAKTLSGSDKKAIASLVKPSLAMWVVNQLYWQDAPTYKALVDASEKLRAAHRAALNGRKVDTSKPDELHRTTVEKALARAVAISQKKGVSLADGARQAVRRTLAALPTEEAPGRLTREPAPAGFSLLTGIKPRPIDIAPAPDHERDRKTLEEQRRKAAAASARNEEEKARKQKEKRDREIAKAEQALREAERRLAKLKG